MLALLLLTAPAYRFPVGQAIEFRATMRFQGFLPILGIGQGKAEVHGTFLVTGKTADSAATKLTAFDVSLNGDKLPIDLDDAQKFFPGGTFTFAANGAVSAWDTPKVSSPIRVPGLDLAHLPQVLIVPVAFPASGVDVGKSFKFSIPLSGGVAEYTVTPTGIDGTGVELNIKVHQRYSGFEDDANQVVTEKDAAFKVATDVIGTGVGHFDLTLGRFDKFSLKDTASSKATDVQSKAVTTRKLSRHLEITS